MSLGLITLVIFLWEKIRKYSVKATMIKATASVLFISLAVYNCLAKGMTFFGMCVIIALVFGLLGDIFLDFKYVFKDQDKLFTYAGFIVFGIGHVFYLLGMYMDYYVPGHPLNIIIPLCLGPVSGLLILLLEKPMKMNYGSMKWIVLSYASLLFMMMASAVSLTILHGFQSTTLILLMAGGILFVISDLILSGTYFAEGKERPVDIITNSVTYYMAQFIIAFSLFFI